MLAYSAPETHRKLVHVTRGRTHGPIARLVSPTNLGRLIKPFVFLDHVDFEDGAKAPPMETLWHPHSGIATVTVLLEGGIDFAETTGRRGGLPAGGVEWMRAGNGVWHTGAPRPGRVRAFQLWIALPPELENAASASQYLLPEAVPAVGPARVILGEYGGARSPIHAPPMTYLLVRLEAGERWTFQPPKGHTVAWAAVHQGEVDTSSGTLSGGEVGVFQWGTQPIELVAARRTELVLGSAASHPHELVLGYYSVHTSAKALERGEAEIRRIGAELVARGTTDGSALRRV